MNQGLSENDGYQLPVVDDTANQQVLGALNNAVNNSAIQTVPAGSSGSFGSSLSANDVDLIEKEWVEKAKAIVKSTQGDPHKQNKLINNVKAEYIKKRYDKDIKVSE